MLLCIPSIDLLEIALAQVMDLMRGMGIPLSALLRVFDLDSPLVGPLHLAMNQVVHVAAGVHCFQVNIVLTQF